MQSDVSRTLRVIARDIDTALIPSLTSPNLKFLASTMKSLLQRAAYSLSSADGPHAAVDIPAGSDWKSVIAWAENTDRENLAGEETSRESAWSQSGSGASADAGATGTRMRVIEPVQLADYLRARADYRWVDEAVINQTAGGFSKDTFLVRLRGGRREDRMVLRRDQAFRPLVTSVADEFNVIQELSASGFPVPKPLWLEASPQYFGAAVLATSWLPGSADSSQWAADPAMARTVIAKAAALLARLHAYPIDKITTRGSGVPGSVGTRPADFVAHLRAFWQSSEPDENPLMDRVLHWLADQAPAEFAKPVIVHSDFGFHNLMVDQGDITGLLDWEFWHVGDAREDLAYTRAFVERLMPWREFCHLYEEAGGIASDPAVERFYSVLGGARIAMGCYGLQKALRRFPELVDSKMIYVGQSFAHRFLIDAAKIAAGDTP